MLLPLALLRLALFGLAVAFLALVEAACTGASLHSGVGAEGSREMCAGPHGEKPRASRQGALGAKVSANSSGNSPGVHSCPQPSSASTPAP